jgi:hypothetical protein
LSLKSGRKERKEGGKEKEGQEDRRTEAGKGKEEIFLRTG